MPPGMWRGETQCTVRKLIRFEEPRNTKGDTCSVLGLDTCTCPYHENSVISCEDDVYCQRSSSASCHPVSEWASRTFQEVQVIISHFFSIGICIQKQLSGGATCLIFPTNQLTPISLLTNDIQADKSDRVYTFSFQAFRDILSTIQLSWHIFTFQIPTIHF